MSRDEIPMSLIPSYQESLQSRRIPISTKGVVSPRHLIHYYYNVTGQSQESEGSCTPARIKEVYTKLHSFQASLCTLTATHLTLIYVCTYIRLSVPLRCLIKPAGIIIHTILNFWETTGIEPVTSGLTSLYQTNSFFT